MADPRVVRLDFPSMSAGALVTEAVRAHLHAANPSSLVERVTEGFREYLAECQRDGASESDRRVAAHAVMALAEIKQVLRDMESR